MVRLTKHQPLDLVAWVRKSLTFVFPLHMNEVANHCNMRIRTVSPSRKEIISTINALKQSKASGLHGLPAELFITATAVTADLLLPLVRKSSKERQPF